MNFKFLLITAFVFNLTYSYAQTNASDSTAQANELVNIEQKLMDGVAIGDSALWKQYLSKEFMIVNEDGSRTFYRDFVNSIKPLPKGSSGHIIVKDPHFHFLGNVAVLNYVADEYESYMGQQLHTTYGTMEVYQKPNDKWQLMNSEVYEIPQLPPAIKVADNILQQYTGTYVLTPDISCQVLLESHHLYLQRKGKKREELFPETINVFFRQADTRGRKLFVKYDDGKWLMRERRNGQDLVWKRKA